MPNHSKDQKLGIIEEMKNHLTNPKTVDNILMTIGVIDVEFERVDRTYLIDSDKVALTVIVRNKAKECLEKAILYFKHGRADYQQLVDVSVGIGSDCDYKIALFDGRQNPNDNQLCEKCYECEKAFVDAMSVRYVPCYLVKVSRKKDLEGNSFYEPKLFKGYNPELINPDQKPFSKTDFERMEFWVSYYDNGVSNPCIYSTDHESWAPDTQSSFNLKCGIRLLLEWGETGLDVVFEADDEEGVEALDWAYENNWSALGNLFKSRNIKLDKITDAESRIIIRMWNNPYRDFVLSDRDGKEKFAGDFVALERQSVEWLDSILSEYLSIRNGNASNDKEL
ncbi:MAG: hypothetical protein C4576_13805 [Desulfobacteraceae bacterium]|nr:MAG: hypothetical protein C4576_13805 [Desulfobacteraceae bacterium]